MNEQQEAKRKIGLGGCLTSMGLLGCLIFLLAPGGLVIGAIVILILLGVDGGTAVLIVFVPATIVMIIVGYLDLVVFADKRDKEQTESEPTREPESKELPPSGFDQWSE